MALKVLSDFLSCLIIVILGSIIGITNRIFNYNRFQYLLESPNNYKSLDHFKKFYDLNKLKWCKTVIKAQEIAVKHEDMYSTQHGIIHIDYTNTESLEFKLMYSNELKQITTTQNVISGVFNYFLYLIYIIFMLKLLHNLYY